MNVYEVATMAEKLKDNTYPGRGIVLGVTPDGKKAVAAYFIMVGLSIPATVYLWKSPTASAPRPMIPA